jgi:hypothetical protein
MSTRNTLLASCLLTVALVTGIVTALFVSRGSVAFRDWPQSGRPEGPDVAKVTARGSRSHEQTPPRRGRHARHRPAHRVRLPAPNLVALAQGGAPPLVRRPAASPDVPRVRPGARHLGGRHQVPRTRTEGGGSKPSPRRLGNGPRGGGRAGSGPRGVGRGSEHGHDRASGRGTGNGEGAGHGNGRARTVSYAWRPREHGNGHAYGHYKRHGSGPAYGPYEQHGGASGHRRGNGNGHRNGNGNGNGRGNAHAHGKGSGGSARVVARG